MRDLRYALRVLLSTPIFTAVAILSLALGIGANTAVFSLVDAVLLRYLPVERPNELMAINVEKNDSLTYPIWDELRRRAPGFPSAAYSSDIFNLSPTGEVDSVSGLWASGDFFKTLGLQPHLGRLFDSTDDVRGAGAHGPVAVISYDFWLRRYGASHTAVGQTIRVEGQPFQIVGVTPPGFTGLNVGRTFDVALPISTEPLVYRGAGKLDQRNYWWVSAIARIPPGISRAQAESRLNAFASEIMAATVPAHATDYLQKRFTLVSAETGVSWFRESYRQSLWVLMAVVGVVLLIACTNLATLLLARASSRQREIAIRLALGAERTALIRQLLIESLILATAGAMLGLAFAWWGSRLLVQLLTTTNNRLFVDLTPDLRVAAFTVAVTALTALGFGLAPALRSTAIPLSAALTTRGVFTSRLTLDKILVATQIALSLVLLAGGGLFLASFYKLVAVERGFDASHVMIANLDIRKLRLAPDQVPLLYAGILNHLRSTPDIRNAAAVEVTPIAGSSWQINLEIPGSTLNEKARHIYGNRVSAGYFATLRIPLLAGRDFDSRDTLTSPTVAIINQTAARRFFPHDNPLGHTVRPTYPPDTKPVEIIGVVGDSKYRRLSEDIWPGIYFADTQDPKPGVYARYAIRYDGPAPKLHEDPEIAVTYRQLETQIDESIARERLLATLSVFFSGLALLLAVIGLYGLMTFAVNRRRSEIGIRVALGATRRSILAMVLRESTIVALAGIALGTAVAFALARYISTLLYGIQPTSAATFIGAGSALLFIALVATIVPARRAATVDPMTALRDE